MLSTSDLLIIFNQGFNSHRSFNFFSSEYLLYLPVPDAFGVKQESVKEIQVGLHSVPVGLAGMEEEWNSRINGVQFIGKVSEGVSLVLLANQVETSYEIRIELS